MRTAVSTVFRLLASLKLAVLLIVVLAAVLAWATLLEASQGRESALWHVYHSSWFAAILALLAVNILAAAMIRFPWKKQQIGFLVAHAGLLVLLVGSIQTFYAGIEGQLSLAEGETASTLLMTDRSQFSVFQQAKQGTEPQLPGAFIFRAGPANWPDGKTLDLGELGGVTLKVLKFYRNARAEENWVRDEKKHGKPAIRLSLPGADGQPATDQWLAVEQFGSSLAAGPAKFELHQVSVNSMQEDFLQPPGKDMDKSGVLSVHYQDQVHRVPVSENVGKKVPLGETGIDVEIAQYLPSAKPSSGGRFVSDGDEPRNPLVELLVHLPGKDKPMRQIAFAKVPWLNLDGIHGWNCPVKFWYHHPAVGAELGAEFLHTPDGKLYCRVGVDGKYKPRGAVKQGDVLEVSPQLKISLLDYLPSARRDVSFYPIELAAGQAEGSEAVALLEVQAGGTTRQVWMKRNDAEHGRQTLETPQGLVGVMFGYERFPLGFSLQLLNFQRGLNPGRMGDASFTSSVKLVDNAAGIDAVHEISMNQPLVHGKFSFYQSSFGENPEEQKTSVLGVAYDPGRFCKYLGSVMMCSGIFIMFYMKVPLGKKLSLFGLRRSTVASGDSAANDGSQQTCLPQTGAGDGRQAEVGLAEVA